MSAENSEYRQVITEHDKCEIDGISIRPLRGTTIEDAADCAIEIAKSHGLPVRFEFNDVVLHVYQSYSRKLVLSLYGDSNLVKQGLSGTVQRHTPDDLW